MCVCIDCRSSVLLKQRSTQVPQGAPGQLPRTQQARPAQQQQQLPQATAAQSHHPQSLQQALQPQMRTSMTRWKLLWQK